jgi:RNA-binding protein
MNKELNAAQRRALRAKAHPLHPVVLIGDNGLTDAVMNEIDVSLRSHELIKVRAQGEREEREAWLLKICERLAAQPVQHIGKTLVLYRERPPEPIPEPAPRRVRSAAKPSARAATKRPARAAPKPAPAPRAQSKRGADRARSRVNAERAPAKAPVRRRAGTR